MLRKTLSYDTFLCDMFQYFYQITFIMMICLCQCFFLF